MNIIKVFLLEDDWMCREAINSILDDEEDIEVEGEAEDGEKGLEKIRRDKPDVVIMDIRLKGKLTGIDATAMLTESDPKIKVIVFTNLREEENLHAAVKAGAVGYLLKKEVTDPDTITKAIRAVVNGDAFITPSIAKSLISIMKKARTTNRFGLTEREIEVIKLIKEGESNKIIADVLSINERTVANHISNTFMKMDVKNRTEAAVVARREGII
jgi:NarL family two-component system response regulator LiaR